MSGIEARVVCDSISPAGKRILSFATRVPKFLLQEINTHAALSKSASSSRAIPTKKVLKQVWKDPFVPTRWGKNQSGMQAHSELSGWRRWAARTLWKGASKVACIFAWTMHSVGLHKQLVNRVVEPWMWANQVITATEWNNFFCLRDHEDAQPEFGELARKMKIAFEESTPTRLPIYDWGSSWSYFDDNSPRFHAPFIHPHEWGQHNDVEIAIMSAARNARASYNNHEGLTPTFEEDKGLFTRLALSKPVHASPLAHIGFAYAFPDTESRNFRGWRQFREVFEVDGWGNYEAAGVVNG